MTAGSRRFSAPFWDPTCRRRRRPLFLHRRPRRVSSSGRIPSVGFSFAQAAADPEFANPNSRDFGPVANSSHQQQPLQACANPDPTNPNPVGFPLVAAFPHTTSSSSSMAATAPKWAQKTVALPPHPRGCHLITSKLERYDLTRNITLSGLEIDPFSNHLRSLLQILESCAGYWNKKP